MAIQLRNTRRGSPKPIQTLAQLEDVLGGQFVIMCGSAISGSRKVGGRLTPFLPLVDEVKRAFLTGASNTLYQGSHYEQTLAASATALAIGKYKSVSIAMKFEDFLGRLESALGSRQQVIELLSALFMCGSSDYCANHSAVGELMRVGRIQACLTTNFDNAFEMAEPQLNRYVYPRHPDKLDRTYCLVKLHGDVETGTYITTVNDLMRDRQRRQHEYLVDLLHNKTILVAGYSGLGDVDIAPHLQASGATLIWLVRNRAAPPFATYTLRCDLRSESENENVLIGLARNSNAKIHDPGTYPRWQDRLAAWIASLSHDTLCDCVMSLIREPLGWPVLHLHHVLEWSRQAHGNAGDEIMTPQLGSACLGVAAYYSAEKAFQAALMQGADELPSRVSLDSRIGVWGTMRKLWKSSGLR